MDMFECFPKYVNMVLCLPWFDTAGAIFMYFIHSFKNHIPNQYKSRVVKNIVVCQLMQFILWALTIIFSSNFHWNKEILISMGLPEILISFTLFPFITAVLVPLVWKTVSGKMYGSLWNNREDQEKSESNLRIANRDLASSGILQIWMMSGRYMCGHSFNRAFLLEAHPAYGICSLIKD